MQFCNLWTSGPLNVHIGNSVVKQISESVLTIKAHIPQEFIRKGRSIVEVDRWIATELSLFLLYTGEIVLKGKLSQIL
jgi:hypothetical protein